MQMQTQPLQIASAGSTGIATGSSDTVVFVGSAGGWDEAMDKGRTSLLPGTAFVIYESFRLRPQIILTRRDVDPGLKTAKAEHNVFHERIGFDVFRVPEGMAQSNASLAAAIDLILGELGPQQGPPSGVEPR